MSELRQAVATVIERCLRVRAAETVLVVADPDSTSEECFEMNNFGLQPNVACDTVE